jgi:DNA-binding IclR family transcriptional regulator
MPRVGGKIERAMEEVEKEKSGGEGVRAVDRALDIMLAFGAADRELTVAELLKRVDLSRPTLYRLLYTLEQNGFLTASGEPQRFRLGPSVGRLAWAWTSSFDLAEVAQPVMRKIWEETGETVALFVPHGATRLCIAEIPSPQPLSFKRGVGYSEKIVRGASGRALLAWMDPSFDQLRKYSDGMKLDVAELQSQLSMVRKQGFAESNDELIVGAVAIAAPFFDQTECVAGSVAIFGPSVRMDGARISELIVTLRQHAASLSALLGSTVAHQTK